MTRPSLRAAVLTVSMSIVFAGWVFGQRADRATVTGVITDPSGQSIAGANVKVRNDDTGVVTDLVTNEAGSYSSPSLVLGSYTITVEVASFKKAVRSGIRLVGGQVFRQDIALELGEVSEQVMS
jgi:Carboxypeptidase regulatory-like domain